MRSAVRSLLELLGGNLFRDLITPGDTVVIKPNWLKEKHEYRAREWDYVITHPAVIKAVLQYVLDALRRRGRVVITDSPHGDSSFERILELMEYRDWIAMAKRAGVNIEVVDLREEKWLSRGGVIVERNKLPGDPRGSLDIDLGAESEFADKKSPTLGYYGADYHSQETSSAHNDNRNFYRVSRTVIEADVVINIPKLKAHKKAGLTACLKNLVGINTNKNWLPHYAIGTQEDGGDQFASAALKNKIEQKIMYGLKCLWARYPGSAKYFMPAIALGRKFFGDTSEVVRSGNWYGNDTLWRMVLDLNKILFYASQDSTMRQSAGKKYLCIVDGVIAGEGNGPEAPEAINTQVLIAGMNPVAVDCVSAKLMGFDYQKVPALRNAFNIKNYPLVDFGYDDIEVLSDEKEWSGRLTDLRKEDMFTFKPPLGWIGHIELQ